MWLVFTFLVVESFVLLIKVYFHFHVAASNKKGGRSSVCACVCDTTETSSITSLFYFCMLMKSVILNTQILNSSTDRLNK